MKKVAVEFAASQGDDEGEEGEEPADAAAEEPVQEGGKVEEPAEEEKEGEEKMEVDEVATEETAA